MLKYIRAFINFILLKFNRKIDFILLFIIIFGTSSYLLQKILGYDTDTYFQKLPEKLKSGDLLAFLGAIFGGLFTLFGVKLTIDYTEREKFLASLPLKFRAIDKVVEDLTEMFLLIEKGQYSELYNSKEAILDNASILDVRIYSAVSNLFYFLSISEEDRIKKLLNRLLIAFGEIESYKKRIKRRYTSSYLTSVESEFVELKDLIKIEIQKQEIDKKEGANGAKRTNPKRRR